MVRGKQIPWLKTVSWNAIIVAQAYHGSANKPVKVCSSIIEYGIKPDSLTFLSLFAGCAHSGMDRMVKESWKIFKSMKKDWNVNLTADHYSCMIDIIGRAGMLIEAYELDLDSRMCVLHSNIYAAKGMWEDAANVRTSLSALHIEETSAVMDRPQMLQRPSATNVNVPQLETFDTARCIGTGSGGLRNLADDVGGSKRRSISEPDSVLRREWALRIGRTSAAMGKYVFPS
nr:hypothetical protein [Tanacetum cinerariifolium]